MVIKKTHYNIVYSKHNYTIMEIIMLVDKTKLENILKDFYVIAGVRIAVFDEWQREVVAYPLSICDYCKRRRMQPEFDELCRATDENAFKMASTTRSQYTYKCHAGLYDSVYPIISDNIVIGYLMIGQFLSNENNQPEQFSPEIDKQIKIIPIENIKAVASIMSFCAEYLHLSKTVLPNRISSYAERAKKYVNDHLNSTVTVQDIADALGLSRTSTHNLFRKHFGRSVTEYVNYQKIEMAKKMIVEHFATTDIIRAINISDPNYFYRMFKQYTGMSVSKFKEFGCSIANIDNERK